MARYLACGLRLAIVLFLSGSAPAFAMPQFLQMFRSDPFRNPAFDGCNTCHMSPEGGDARNMFGQAFESAGERITTLLRAQFPDRFIYPVSKVSETLTIHFSDPNNKQVVVEAGGMKNLVDVERKTVNDTPAVFPSAPAAATSAVSGTQAAERRSEVPVDPYAREGAFFGSNVVNLPNGKPQRAGGWDFFIGHRFSSPICLVDCFNKPGTAGPADLFGFDSAAVVGYGLRVGVSDHVSVFVLRSNLFKTISLSSALQVSRQSATMPLTLQVRGGVDGKNNFGLYRRSHNPAERQYSPFIQVVTTRTFKDRISFTAVPTFAFNTRDETRGDDIPGFAFGFQHNHTIALGLGTGVRVLPSVSLVGEFIPRLWGFRGEFTDRPSVSIGLQKSTFRHTFELLISRQQPMTVAQYSFQGLDTFRIGFNIYRKLR
ncbi:MAG: hypothetical protein DMG15_11195 [Acidobacteria bacterium]|nr:MAG: hypothetical protein DMG15_11195 [Acidobacteriota bacterium]